MSTARGLVCFDLDGTLIDSIADIAGAANEAVAARYAPARSLPVETIRAFVGSGARVLIDGVVKALGEPQAEVDVLFPMFLERYGARLLRETRVYAGLLEALAALESAGFRLAVLTNKPGDMSRAIVRGLGLGERFLDVIGGDDLATKKPDPEGLLRLAAAAGVPPARVALVGDSAVDVRTAKAAGALAVGVAWGYDVPGMRAAGPDVEIAAPEALPDAVLRSIRVP